MIKILVPMWPETKCHLGWSPETSITACSCHICSFLLPVRKPTASLIFTQVNFLPRARWHQFKKKCWLVTLGHNQRCLPMGILLLDWPQKATISPDFLYTSNMSVVKQNKNGKKNILPFFHMEGKIIFCIYDITALEISSNRPRNPSHLSCLKLVSTRPRPYFPRTVFFFIWFSQIDTSLDWKIQRGKKKRVLPHNYTEIDKHLIHANNKIIQLW